MANENFSGSCHCGAVRFTVALDLDGGTTKCNCSICTKSRAWIFIVKPESFSLVAGEHEQTEYGWLPEGRSESVLHYRFCKTCGVRTPGWGEHESMGGRWWFVPVTTLDDLPIERIAAAPVRYVDGRHDRFDQPAPGVQLP